MIYGIFHQGVIQTPDHRAIVTSDGKPWSYCQVNTYVLGLSAYLLAQGLTPNDRVGVLLDNEDWHVFFLLALDRLKVTYVPFDADMPQGQLSKALPELQLKTLIMDSQVMQNYFAIDTALLLDLKTEFFQSDLNPLPEYEDGSDAFISYLVASSGTTSTKKWIPLLEKGLAYWANVLTEQVQLEPGDRILASRSPAFDARIFEYLMAFSAKGSLYLITRYDRRDFSKIQTLCEKENITAMLFIASALSSKAGLTLIARLKQSGMKHLFVTGDACTVDLKTACEKEDIKLWNAYGPTEATFGLSLICVNGYQNPLPSNTAFQIPIGKPWGVGVTYVIQDGKLYIDSPYLTPGYLNAQDSALNFIEINGKRMFDTGDAFAEREGHLFYLGRYGIESHCKINGVKVTAHSVEQCLLEYNQVTLDGLMEAAVVIKSVQGKAGLFAYLVIDDAFDKIFFNAYLKSHLSKEALPTLIALTELPRMIGSDKINRQALIAREEDDIDEWFKGLDFPSLEKSSLAYEHVKKIWQQVLGRRLIPLDIDFLFLGGDSIKAIEMVHLIQKQIKPSYQYSDLLSLNEITLKKVVESLSVRRTMDKNSALITLLHASKTSVDNLFFLPALLGDGKFSYKTLVECLLNYPRYFNQTMYGLSEPGLYDETALPVSFEQAIARYVTAIKSIQPNGPYRLLGFSFGGTLAYGVAAALEKDNETISCLYLMDALPPRLYQKLDKAAHFTFFMALITFLVSMLNNDYYGESLKKFIIKKGETLAVDKQIKSAFLFLKRKITHVQSLRLLNVAERHLEFMGSIEAPAKRLMAFPEVSFTQKDQNYLSVISALSLPAYDCSYKSYGWNEYFWRLRCIDNRPNCQHLGIVTDPLLANAYWQRTYFLEHDFEHDLIDVMPVYQSKEQKGEVELSLFFLSGRLLVWIQDHLYQQGIHSNCFYFDNFYEKVQQTYIIKLAVLYAYFPLAKLPFVLEGLAEKNITERRVLEPELLGVLENRVLPGLPVIDFEEEKKQGIMDLHFGLHQTLIDFSFTFKIERYFDLFCQTVKKIQNKPSINPVKLNRLQFFHPLNNMVRQEAILEESETLITLMEIKVLLDPYYKLDQSLCGPQGDGFACFKKYSNNREGLSPSLLLTLTQLAKAIIEERFTPENPLPYVDALVLFSNHLDQKRMTEGESLAQNNQTVLLFLSAAYKISPLSYKVASLVKATTLELSSHAQLLHYLGKAERYSDCALIKSPENRLIKLKQALDIALRLERQSTQPECDPHYFLARIPTFILAINYCYQDLKRYHEALEVLKPALFFGDKFHQIQANIQMANVHMALVLESSIDSLPNSLEKSLFHAKLAFDMAAIELNALLQCNAHDCYMRALYLSDSFELANAMALQLIEHKEEGMPLYLREGVKPHHIDSANDVLQKISTLELSLSLSR